jgi:glutamine synthetase
MVEMTPERLAEWLEENAITSVRIEGTNLDGSFIGKNLSVKKFVGGLESGFAFADVAFGLDLGNTPYFGFPMPSWRGDLPDIYLRPDLSTLCVWEPGRASVIGDFWTPLGEPLSACPRNTLRRLVAETSDLSYEVATAVEIEATIFEESIHEARQRNYQGLTPLGGTSGSAYHLTKSKDWDDYLRRVCERLDEVGIPWEAWNDEAATGQIEINLAISDPVAVSDWWARTRQVMREVAFERGHCVTFMAKWCDEYGQASHINMSLGSDGDNVFHDPDGPSEVMRHFIGGVVASLAGATSLALPWITSYRRLVELDGPPTTVTWGINNKTTAVRAVVAHPRYSRIEYRVPGSDSNMYLVCAALLGAGLAGIKQRIEPPAPYPVMAWCAPPDVERLPRSITQAALALGQDKLLIDALGQELVDYWLGMRRWEWMMFHTTGGDPDAAVTEWESIRYFELV